MSPNLPVYISRPTVGEEEWEASKEVFTSGWVTQGPKVAEFEKAFARAHNCEFAVATTSCTTGLHLSLVALGVGPGDEVIVPSFTWVSTANVVVHCGAKPVFADIDPKTFNISLETMKNLVNKNTKAVIPVHLFGLCADVVAIREAFPELAIVEDAACAVGSKIGSNFAGAMGHAGVFSLHPRKLITTGEGGMITTNRSDVYDKLVELRNHGASISEEDRHKSQSGFLLPRFKSVGFNYRMTDIQGVVGLVQMKKLDELIEQRQQFADIYKKELSDVDWLNLPEVPDDSVMNWQSYVTLMDPDKSPGDRDQMLKHLFDNQIHCRPGTHAAHLLECYESYAGLDLPGTQWANSWSLSLPIHNKLTNDDILYVCEKIKSFG